MVCVVVRSKKVVVFDVHSHIASIAGIPKPIANLIAALPALRERLVTRPTKLVIRGFTGNTIGGNADISPPTRIALYDNLSSSTSKQKHNQGRQP
jgi:hypothetical protein